MFQLDGEVGITQKERGQLENTENVADLDKKDEIIQLQKGNAKGGIRISESRRWRGKSKEGI